MINVTKNVARKLSTEEQHLIRKIAVQRVHDGETAAEVTRSFGLGSQTMFTWLRLAREKRIKALVPKARTGRNRPLSDIEEQKIKSWIPGGAPRQHDFAFGLWTRHKNRYVERMSETRKQCKNELKKSNLKIINTLKIKGLTYFGRMKPLFVLMTLYSVPGVKKERHLSSEKAIKGRLLMLS